MNKALRIFARDLRRILRNPVATIVMLGLAVVPCLYAWVNIAANWDPYENTSDIGVAVVNEDQPVEVGSMGAICAGDMVVDALRENDQIGWEFTDLDEALEGVRSGRFYAAIVIPEDFTEQLANVLDGDTTKATLTYYVNEKANAIAPKVTDTGASTIETQIDNEFMGVVSKVVLQKLQGFTEGVEESAGNAVDNAQTTLGEVRSSLGQIDGQLADLSADLADASDALLDAKASMQGLSGTGEGLGSALDATLRGISTTREDANALVTRLSGALASGAGTISGVSSRATHDVSSLAGDIAFAQSRVAAAITQLEGDLTDTEALVSELRGIRSLVVAIEPTDEGIEGIRLELERELDVQIGVMVQISDEQAAKLDELRALAERLEAGANEVAGISARVNDGIQDATNTLVQAQSGVVANSLANVNAALDAFSSIASELAAAAQVVDPLIDQSCSVVGQLSGTLADSGTALANTRDTLRLTMGYVDAISADLDTLRASEAWSLLDDVLDIDAGDVGTYMSAPVTLVEEDLYPVENYASGVAPFFTSLALWVGGIALVAIYKLEVDEEGVGPVRPWQAYLGRWLLFVMVSAMQAVACCTGDLLLGIQCVHPGAFYLSALVAAFVFTNIIFALSVAFRHVGKALAFTMIILQVPGSSGTYPIEMMPDFFQAIYPWLPFTYSNNAMREAIAGYYDGNLAKDLLMLLLFVVPSLLVGITCRGHLLNINALFDKRLRQTDHLMVSEVVDTGQQHYRLATIVKALLNPQEYQEAFAERSAGFERLYPTLVRRGLLMLFVVPAVLFCLMLVLDSSLPILAIWVVSLVGICTFLIVVEYFHDRVERKEGLAQMSQDELEELLNESLRDELLAFAPIDTVLERRVALRDRGLGTQARHLMRRGAGDAEQDGPATGGAGPGDAAEGGDER